MDLPRVPCEMVSSTHFTLRTDFAPRLEYRFGTKTWRFFPGCELPPRKKVKNKEDVSESTKNYEKNKRQWAFQNSWKQGRTWLVFDDNVMFCTVCKESAAMDATVSHKNSFTSGNCQFKSESIKLHEESRNHKSAKAVVAAKNRPCETPVVKFLLTLNSRVTSF